ncbi:MAG: polysaccharide biosynthesis/export family protein [Terriglobales bacterium]
MSLLPAWNRRVWIVAVIAGMLPAFAQEPQQPSYAAPSQSQQAQPSTTSNANPSTADRSPAHMQISSPASATPTEMLIGPGDEGDLSAYGVPELNTHFRVEGSGDVYLPLIGKFHIAGLTSDAAQAELNKMYEAGGYLRNAHVNVYIKEYTTQGISVLGEVNHPGIYSALNARRLFDVFLIAGGLTPRAGRTATIAHAKEPDKPIVVPIRNNEGTGEANIEIQPGDTVTVSAAGVVYVIGEVNRPGAFVLDSTQSPSLLQIMAAAAGPTHLAQLSHTRLIRQTPKGLESKDVDLKKIMQAKAGDIAVEANDIVFVPGSRGKSAMERGSSSVLSMLTNLALYRF